LPHCLPLLQPLLVPLVSPVPPCLSLFFNLNHSLSFSFSSTVYWKLSSSLPNLPPSWVAFSASSFCCTLNPHSHLHILHHVTITGNCLPSTFLIQNIFYFQMAFILNDLSLVPQSTDGSFSSRPLLYTPTYLAGHSWSTAKKI
jgi:hypothetical protein